MDHSRRILPGSFHDTSDEDSRLLQDDIPRRPYQPYCETVASSRPPSPDPLIPKPLRITPAPSKKKLLNLRLPSPQETNQNTALVPSVTNNPEQIVDAVTLPKTGSYTKSQADSPNRNHLPKNRISADVNHIARAVTPRGSHSLDLTVVTVYAQTPSHPRVQQSIPSQGAVFQTIRRKPIHRYGNRTESEHHPLPSLPLEPIPVECDIGQVVITQDDRSREECYERPYTGTPSCLGDEFENVKEGLLPQQAPQYAVAHQPAQEPYTHLSQSAPPRRVAFEEPLPLSNLSVTLTPCTIYLRSSSQIPKRDNILDDDAQFPSSDELYVPRGLLSGISDDQRAQRRTLPKDANLRYQFGELPQRDPGLSPLIPSHRDPYRTDHPTYVPTLSPPSLHSTDTQPGPRPPPWDSFSDLEMQRRQRGDTRERAQTRVKRLTADSLSTYQKSYSSDSLYKDPMKEVEEYREQIRRVYPDMEFDGRGGSGGRGWCCNVM